MSPPPRGRQREGREVRSWVGRLVPAQHQGECCLIVLRSVCGGDHRVMVRCPLVFCPQTAVLRQALAALGILRREHPHPLCFHQSLVNNALQCHTAKCSWGGKPPPPHHPTPLHPALTLPASVRPTEESAKSSFPEGEEGTAPAEASCGGNNCLPGASSCGGDSCPHGSSNT